MKTRRSRLQIRILALVLTTFFLVQPHNAAAFSLTRHVKAKVKGAAKWLSCNRRCVVSSNKDPFENGVQCLVSKSYHPKCITAFQKMIESGNRAKNKKFFAKYDALNKRSQDYLKIFIRGKLHVKGKESEHLDAERLREKLAQPKKAVTSFKDELGKELTLRYFNPSRLSWDDRKKGDDDKRLQLKKIVKYTGKIVAAKQGAGAVGQILLSTGESQGYFFIPGVDSDRFELDAGDFIAIAEFQKIDKLPHDKRSELEKTLQEYFAKYHSVSILPTYFAGNFTPNVWVEVDDAIVKRI